MPTTKKRINVCLMDDVSDTLTKLAERDQVPTATKAAYLIKIAIEIDEDDIFNRLAEERDTKNGKFISHKQAWK